MKRLQWGFAAVCFTLCVGIAVWTVAIRSGNLGIRRTQGWQHLDGRAALTESQRLGMMVHLQSDGSTLAQLYRQLLAEAARRQARRRASSDEWLDPRDGAEPGGRWQR